MQPRTREANAILAHLERPYERSPLFEWLLAHHDEVVAAAGGRRIEWARLCAEFQRAGLTTRDGRTVGAPTARKTWQRVRKEKARIEAMRATESAERERRASANPRRNMPSQFRQSDYGRPPVTTTAPAPSKPPATTLEQASLGFRLSTAEGVVVTKAGRVFKRQTDGNDYAFREDGMIIGRDGWAAALQVKQQLNVRGGRPINDLTEDLYEKLGLRSENP